MSEIEKAIDSCNNLISKYQKRLDGADFHRGSTIHALELERVKISALEKQIPKKPDGRYCPTCGYGGLEYDKEQSIFVIIDYHHCNSCGQAIDWSEEVEG